MSWFNIYLTICAVVVGLPLLFAFSTYMFYKQRKEWDFAEKYIFPTLATIMAALCIPFIGLIAPIVLACATICVPAYIASKSLPKFLNKDK